MLIFLAYANGLVSQHKAIPVDNDLTPELRHVVMVENLFDDVIPQIKLNGEAKVEFRVDGYEIIQLDLVKSDIISSNYFVTADQTDQKQDRAIPLKGWTADGGDVRLTISSNMVYGYIVGQEHTYWMEPYRHYNRQAEDNQTLLYRERDVLAVKHGTCAVHATHRRHQSLHQKPQIQKRLGQCYEVDIAIASDFGMYQRYNSSVADVENRNIGVINNVNGDYTGSFDDDIEFNIITQFVSTSSGSDPWTSSANAGNLLNSFTSWGQSGGFGVPLDLGELWTTRDLTDPGSTPPNGVIGLAWVGTACRNSKYHILEDYSMNAQAIRVLTSHEIGHNFDADHAPASGFIMSPTVSNTTNWHPTPAAQISSYINFMTGLPNCLSACPVGTPPTPAIDVLAAHICEGTTTRFYDRSDGQPFSWNWTFPGGIPATSTAQNPEVTYNNAGTYSVTLSVTNAGGTETQTFTNYVTVGAIAEDVIEYQDFENGLGNWTVLNPDNSLTWQLTNVNTALAGSQVLGLNNSSYSSVGQRDQLISPVLNLAGRTTASLGIDYAYTTRPGFNSDSLVVSISTDGGVSYERLAAFADNGSSNFITRSPLTNGFVPNSLEDWCGQGAFGAACIDIDLSPYVGQRDVLIQIENVTQNGNNMFLDKVFVLGDCFDLPLPVAAFTSDVTTGCAPLSVQYMDLSQNSPFSWTWNFDGGTPIASNEQNPQVVYMTEGTFDVLLSVQNETGIGSSAQLDYITVLDEPQADFDFDVNGRTVDFTNLTNGGSVFIWDFGDTHASTNENPQHTYDMDGDYNVTLNVTNACGSSQITKTVVVATPPMAGFTYMQMDQCVPDSIRFNSTSSPNTTSVFWNFEGGSPATSVDLSPTVIYDSSGVFDVMLIAVNANGQDTLLMTNEIVINDVPTAAFSATTDMLTVTFMNVSSTDADEFMWFFGDGDTSTDIDPEHTYPQADVYEVTLIASNECGDDTVQMNVSVGGFPVADIAITPFGECATTNVGFEAVGALGTDQVLWMFEGGIPAMSMDKFPSIAYTQPGTYDVTLIVTNGIGSDTLTLIDGVEIGGPPSVNFDVNYDGFIRVNPTYNGSSFDSIVWRFGDGFITDEVSPSHPYDAQVIYEEGQIKVTCYAWNTCGVDSLMKTEVITPDLFEFGLPQDALCLDDTYTYVVTLGSGSIDDVFWTLEGATPAASTDPSVSVTYASVGIYDVRCQVIQNMDTASILLEDRIEVINSAIADFEVIDQFVSNQSANASSYQWIIDDVVESTDEDFFLTRIGTYDLTLIAENACSSDTLTKLVSWTSIDQTSNDVEIKLAPNPNSGHFSLTAKSTDILHVELYDANGQQLREWLHDVGVGRLDVSEDLVPGLYLLRILDERGDWTIKRLIVID